MFELGAGEVPSPQMPGGPAPFRPGPGQESVWSYPRPPRVEPTGEHVVVTLGGRVIADSTRAVRVLETSHPPVYYLPMADIDMSRLRPSGRTSWCEFKGLGVSLDSDTTPDVAWFYPNPSPGYEHLRDYIAFHPGRVDSATVNGETVRPQDGTFYGGWITDRVVGPFKGSPGTRRW